MAKSKKNDNEPEASGVDADSPPFDRELYRAGVAAQVWSYSDTGHDLTVEEQLFCRSYIIDRNAIAALRRLNYDGPAPKLQAIANRHLRNSEVQGCIEVLAKRMMERLDITADKVNEGLAEIAFSDPGEIMEFDHTGVHVLHSRYWTPGMRRTVQSVKMGQNGVEVKFYDRQKALETLGKQVGVVDDDAKMQREIAEAAAAAATNRIMEVVGRMREGPKLVGAPDKEKAA